MALCFGTIAPLPAAHLLIEPYSWRLFFYVVLAFAIVLFILTFFFVEETSYDRKAQVHAEYQSEENGVHIIEKPSNTHENVITPATSAPEHFIPERKSFIQTLSPWGRFDPSVPFFMTMARSFTYFLVPQVLWVITSFGIYIGLGAFAFNYTFPIKITSPPYNWSVVRLIKVCS